MKVDGSEREWLETDGYGGFAMGTAVGYRTRRYHALLCKSLRPPVERIVLVNGLEVWWESRSGFDNPSRCDLSTQVYAPGVIHPSGHQQIERFTNDPWPTWTYRISPESSITHDLFIPRKQGGIVLRWRYQGSGSAGFLCVRPLLSGRDYHSLQTENSTFNPIAVNSQQTVRWQTYPELPAVVARHNGEYVEEMQWYRQFLYFEEQERGLDCVEDLGSPGVFHFDLSHGDAVLYLEVPDPSSGVPGFADFAKTDLTAGGDLPSPAPASSNLPQQVAAWESYERSWRVSEPTPLHRAAESYLVRRGAGLSIIAGYPWFSDWGRDTFISIRGLCLATHRLGEARDVLLAWSRCVSQGMLPNRFSDDGPPEFNAVDASLWFVVAAGEFIKRCESIDKRLLAKTDRELIEQAIESILDGYAIGTRYNIQLAEDGLLAAGVPGVQLTWMDAKVGDYVVTPRIGKPVEVQALWLNALKQSSQFHRKWGAAYRRGKESFLARFWNENGGYLHDVVDVNHEANTVSTDFRSNQIFAVGGLPEIIVPPEVARQIVDRVEERLWTLAGLRTLSPNHPDYRSRYEGDPWHRDTAYHQGTVWPWLTGPFVEAWVRVRGDTPEVRKTARTRFLEPLLSHLDPQRTGHLPEIAEGDAPHRARGCPFQAWSVAEILRLSLEVLA